MKHFNKFLESFMCKNMQVIADLLQPMKWSFSTNRTCLAFFGTYFA